MSKIVLIDLSVIFRRRWHASEHEPVSTAMRGTVAEVHEWAKTGDHTVVCIDTPPYLRTELYPEYKAQREKAPKSMFGEQDAAIQRLRDDGLLVLGARGFEADDIIATLVTRLPAEHEISIITGDKDALQLVSERVTVTSPATGVVMTPQAVEESAKIGVRPSQIVDWLALVGDASDNIPGVPGWGPVNAAKYLREYDSVAGIFANASKLPEKKGVALVEAEATVRTALVLVKLRDDAPIDTAEVFTKREAKRLAEPDTEEPPPSPEEDDMPEPEVIAAPERETATPDAPRRQAQALAKTNGGTVPFELALEPRNIAQAEWLAKVLYSARLFGEYNNVEAVLGTILTGRSFGIDAVTSLRSFHVIKGKQTMSATLMVGLVKKRVDICKYFRLVESTTERAVYETLRAGEPEPTRMDYTIAEAKTAGLTGKGGNWDARPKTMLRHRCATELARAVYPDLVAGIYSSEEMQDAA